MRSRCSRSGGSKRPTASGARSSSAWSATSPAGSLPGYGWRPPAPAARPGGGSRGRGAAPLQLVVTSSRPFQQRHLVQFEGIDSRDEADALRGVVLKAAAVEDPEALFVHELVGSEVIDQAGASHGRVAAVEANPASDLLVGEGGWLVPLRFVVEHRDGQIVIDAPDGLFE